MPDMVICKACGFVIEKGKLKDKCPACGVLAKMFLPHDERISPQRKRLLMLDIHPVMVHFPQAFTGTLLLLSIAGLVINLSISNYIEGAVRTLGVLLPVTLALSIASGLFDGKLRFRKVKTPILTKKIFLGTCFLLCGCAIAVVAIVVPPASKQLFLLVAAFSLPALGLATVLGLMGTSLLNARFPG
jgi:hypothetical protein